MGYECIMCMEPLENPAPTTAAAAPPSDNPDANANEEGIGPGPSRPRKKRPVKQISDDPEDLARICATACGHLFHRICLDRWFSQKIKKECPSCRKPLTVSKIFRIYPPGSSEDCTANMNTNTINLTDLEERSIPSCECANKECIHLHTIHKTLISDYNTLLDKFHDKVDENAVLSAQLASFETLNPSLEDVRKMNAPSPNTNENHEESPRCNVSVSRKVLAAPKSRKTCAKTSGPIRPIPVRAIPSGFPNIRGPRKRFVAMKSTGGVPRNSFVGVRLRSTSPSSTSSSSSSSSSSPSESSDSDDEPRTRRRKVNPLRQTTCC